MTAVGNAVGIVPTLGRIVWYKMANWCAEEVNRRRKHAYDSIDYHRHYKRGTQVHQGNSVEAGKLYPAMIVAVWGDAPDSCVNLKVFLDGSDDLWVTSVKVGEDDHTYQWMPFQKWQAAKTEAAEKPAAAGPSGH